MDHPNTSVVSDLEIAILILRRRGWIILVSALIFGGAAFAITKSQPKEYMASASLLFGTQNAAQQATGLPSTSQNDPDGQRDTNVALVQLSQGVSARAAQALGNPDVTSDDIDRAVTAELQGRSNIVSVVATWSSPRGAARIANGYAQAFIAEQLRVDRRGVQNAVVLVQDQLAALTASQRRGEAGQSLRDREQSLRILNAMQSNTRVVRSASVPARQSAPNVTRGTAVGLFIGLLVGLSAAFAVHRLDRRLRDTTEVEKLWARPTLGLIAQSANLSTMDIDGRATGPMIEPFRVLRAQVQYFNVGRDIKVLLVSSAEPGEGKTTTAAGLAIAAASAGSRVLLIEADLRRPRLANLFAVTATDGLVGALMRGNGVGLEESTQSVPVGGDDSVGALDLLVAETSPPNPADLVESEAMASLLSAARDAYDLVVIDTPPLGIVPDAIPLLNKVDGLLIVSRLGVSQRDTSTQLRERLDNLKAPLLGVVINGVRTSQSGYYGYSTLEKP